jgi:hypothetical protein
MTVNVSDLNRRIQGLPVVIRVLLRETIPLVRQFLGSKRGVASDHVRDSGRTVSSIPSGGQSVR